MDDGRVTHRIAGEAVILLPERALWWPGGGVLMVADVHLGRIAALRVRGVPVPGDSLGATLERLARIAGQTQPERIVVLGDFVQNREGLTPRVVERVGEALAELPAPLEVVPGNHERSTGPLPGEWPVEMLGASERVGPFVLRHEPEPVDGGYVLAGHYHPTVRMEGGGDALRLPCFAFGDEVGVLPAFHTMTNGVGMSVEDYRVFAVTDDVVIDLHQ
jgi:hypothetical protein